MCIEREVGLREVLGGVWILTKYIWKSQGIIKMRKGGKKKRERKQSSVFLFTWLNFYYRKYKSFRK